MKWNNSHKNPPEVGQKVYYFGENIGIGIGHYTYEEQRLIMGSGRIDINLCPHIFTNVDWGVVDACDAPFWLPYDEEDAKSWCPIIPEEYTKGLYDNS
jgi:hypothetical protein